MLALGLPATSRMVSVPAFAVYLSVRPSTAALWCVVTSRSSTGASVYPFLAWSISASEWIASRLLGLSPEDWPKAGTATDRAIADAASKRRIWQISLGLGVEERCQTWRNSVASCNAVDEPAVSVDERPSNEREKLIALCDFLGEINLVEFHSSGGHCPGEPVMPLGTHG